MNQMPQFSATLPQEKTPYVSSLASCRGPSSSQLLLTIAQDSANRPNPRAQLLDGNGGLLVPPREGATVRRITAKARSENGAAF
jgi:hypothetical protein